MELSVVARARRAAPGPLDLPALPAGLLAAACALLLGGALGLHHERRRLERVASTDALTGLANRRSLEAALRRELERPHPDAVLVLLDLDGFKSYNDTFGHPAGDDLLRRRGAALREAIAPLGAAFRLGGDEFCALCDGSRRAEAEAAAAAALSERGAGYAIEASYGTAALPGEAATPSDALHLADVRMYESKRRRRAARAA
ncbi:MAG: GGDEF domain-containing protein [Solirubrobacterales bacterium]|nr:GGDEF domain-containing protein [Solirubrobacterales bacterium]